MFGLGITEILFIMIVALVVLGPKNLPKAARSMGRFFGQIQRMTSDITSSINEESFQAERQEARKKAATVVKAEPAPADAEPSDETAAHDGEFVYDELKQDVSDARVVHDKPGPPPLDDIEPPEDIPDDDKPEES